MKANGPWAASVSDTLYDIATAGTYDLQNEADVAKELLMLLLSRAPVYAVRTALQSIRTRIADSDDTLHCMINDGDRQDILDRLDELIQD